MKRILLVAAMATTMVMAYAGTAFAAGWWVEYGSGVSGDGRILAPLDGTDGPNAVWDSRDLGGNLGQGNPNTPDNTATPSPHGGFSAQTNYCKTCHAVHGADNASFRLLHAENRKTECEWCHYTGTGRSSHRPYEELLLRGKTPRGEHTPGATKIPDSQVNSGSGVWGNLPNLADGTHDGTSGALNCYYCHSVHGGDTIQNAGTRWIQAVLRNDPAGNGKGCGTGAAVLNTGGCPSGQGPQIVDFTPTTQDYDPNTMTVVGYEKARFCSDCHNKNPNFGNDNRGSDNTGGGSRPNRTAHPTRGDGFVEIYGNDRGYSDPTLKRVPNTATAAEYLEVTVSNGLDDCLSCHQATTFTVGDARSPGVLLAGGNGSDFPHQSIGHKLLADNYTVEDAAWNVNRTGDPMRPLPQMDTICLECHDPAGERILTRANGSTFAVDFGVGKTF